MLGAWRASNLLDSMTDAFYAGAAPTEDEVGRVQDLLSTMQRTCEIDTEDVRDELVKVSELVGVGNMMEAKSAAGAARSKMQKLLEVA